MNSIIGLTAVVSVALLCAASPLIAQNAAHPVEPSLVFVPQAKPKPQTKPKTRRVERKGRTQAILAAEAKKASLTSVASISQAYGDWIVNCGAVKGTKFCTTGQAQVDKRTKQRIFAIELRTSKGGSTEGTILMPFGLKLESGVVIKVDNEEQKLPFSTCLAQGCFVKVALPDAAIGAIRKAKMFTVGALQMSNNQIITFNVSLNGFDAAIARADQFASSS